MKKQEENKILIHACCGVCFSYPLLFLRELGYAPIVYFANSNIYPQDEFERRYIELEKYCSLNKVELLKEKYDHQSFLEFAEPFKDEQEKGKRCVECFYDRLSKTAKKAVELNINKITTTLSISPHKISRDIFEAGKKAALLYDVEFIEFDFKKKDGFKKTSEIAYAFGMYRQQYCGCEFSMKKIKNT